MGGSDVSELESHVGYWLRFVSNQASQAFSRKLATSGVTVAEWVVLRELFAREPVAPSELAERLGMTRGAISKLVDRLAEKALVRKAVDQRDRRFQSVALTAEGRALVPKLAALADENDRAFFGALSEGERQVLMRLMRELVRAHGLKEVPID